MKVLLHLDSTANPIIYEDAEDVFEKGSYTCVYLKGKGETHSYPTSKIFRLIKKFKPGTDRGNNE